MSWTSSEGGDNDRPHNPYSTSPPSDRGNSDRPPAYREDEPVSAPAWPGDPVSPQFGEPAAAQLPKSIRTAARLMYVGAGIALLNLISVFIFRDDIREMALDSALDNELSDADAAALADSSLALLYGAYIVAIVLWLWMAYANRKGKLWARATATVLGGLFIAYTLLTVLAGGGGGLNMVFSLATLALSAYILYLLYRPESTEYYRASSRRF